MRRTALHVAASEGTKDMIELLLALGADPALRDNRGWTPLIRAW